MAVACGGADDLPGQAEIDSARQRVEAAVSLADHAKTVLEMLGLLPSYDCGQPRRSWVGEIAAGFSVEHPCASAVAEQDGADGDRVRLTFPEAGCRALGRELAGEAVFAYSGGSDRFSLDADFSALRVAGETLGGHAGYGTCGDEKRVWAGGAGRLPGLEVGFAFDITVAIRSGIPIFGSTTLILDGDGQLGDGAASDQVFFQQLKVEPGALLPKAGLLRIVTADGHRIEARFADGLLIGQVEIRIDDHEPVTVPLF